MTAQKLSFRYLFSTFKTSIYISRDNLVKNPEKKGQKKVTFYTSNKNYFVLSDYEKLKKIGYEWNSGCIVFKFPLIIAFVHPIHRIMSDQGQYKIPNSVKKKKRSILKIFQI